MNLSISAPQSFIFSKSMPISLSKNQIVSLSKEDPYLQKIMCGLGWDLGKKSGKAQLYDLDSYLICLNSSGKLSDRKNIIYFNNLVHSSGAIVHQGDNITGIGDGDDEIITVDLTKLPPEIARFVFIINIYRCIPRQQDFSQIENAFVRLVNLNDDRELARYNLSGQTYQGMTGMVLAEIYRQDNEWVMEAIGKGFKANELDEIIERLNYKDNSLFF